MSNEQIPIAVTDEKVKNWLTVQAKELRDFAIRRYDERPFLQSIFLAILDTPELRQCMTTEAGRGSIKQAIRRAASLGLSLNPQEGKACMVPYKGKVQYQVMKDGYIDLLLDTAAVKVVRIGTVYKNDTWEQWESSDGDGYKLIPARTDRGTIDLFYAAAIFNDGSCALKTLDTEQAKEHRKKYSEYSKLGEKEYGEKTVAKMLCKTAKVASVAPLIERGIEQGEPDEIPEPGSEHDVTEKGTSAQGLAETLGEAEHKTDEIASKVMTDEPPDLKDALSPNKPDELDIF